MCHVYGPDRFLLWLLLPPPLVRERLGVPNELSRQGLETDQLHFEQRSANIRGPHHGVSS